MKYFIICFVLFSSIVFTMGFSIGAFEYQTGSSMFAKFEINRTFGPLELGVTHWLFWRTYNFGFYDFPNRITPFDWVSLGGWWDAYVVLRITENMYFRFIHRSEHNFDSNHFLNIHWYNMFELGWRW